MVILIKPFEPKDGDYLVEILKVNQQYSYPNVDGPEAMLRVAQCHAAVFLTAADNERAVGCIRATYDGARAMIHLLSVHAEYQNRGIGTKLVKAAIKELKTRGRRRSALPSPIPARDTGISWDLSKFRHF
jgi:GNAT superfamily N-acetyltransferase